VLSAQVQRTELRAHFVVYNGRHAVLEAIIVELPVGLAEPEMQVLSR